MTKKKITAKHISWHPILLSIYFISQQPKSKVRIKRGLTYTDMLKFEHIMLNHYGLNLLSLKSNFYFLPYLNWLVFWNLISLPLHLNLPCSHNSTDTLLCTILSSMVSISHWEEGQMSPCTYLTTEETLWPELSKMEKYIYYWY